MFCSGIGVGQWTHACAGMTRIIVVHFDQSAFYRWKGEAIPDTFCHTAKALLVFDLTNRILMNYMGFALFICKMSGLTLFGQICA